MNRRTARRVSTAIAPSRHRAIAPSRHRAIAPSRHRAIAAAAALDVPAVYCATTTDMLHPHLARLPPMKPGQSIVDIGDSFARKREVIAQNFAAFGSDGPAPPDRDAIGTTMGIARQFIDGTAGQLHLRFAGDRAAPPLLLLHDAPGSSDQAEPLIAALSRHFFVVAPDLPGHGESDAFADAPGIAAFADEAAALLTMLGVGPAIVYGIGFGSSVALALAEWAPHRVSALIVQGVLLPDAVERTALAAHYAPPIEIAADGSHWYRTWLMLRDQQVYWPWYDRRFAALRRVPADFGARPLHRWTMDVMRARASYGQLIQAALAHDAAAALAVIAMPIVQVRDAAATPLCHYDAAAAALCRDAAALTATDDLAAWLAMRFDHREETNRVYSET